MATSVPTITVKSGDDRTLTLQIYAQDGTTPENLTGALELKFQVGSSLAGPAVISKSLTGGEIEIISATGGLVNVTFVPSDTAALAGLYVWEFEITTALSKTFTVYFSGEGRYHSTMFVETDLIT